MWYPKDDWSKIRFATICAAVFLYILKRQRDPVAIWTWGIQHPTLNQRHPPSSRPGTYMKYISLLNIIYNSTPKHTKPVTTSLMFEKLIEQTPRHSMIVVLSDLASPSLNPSRILTRLKAKTNHVLIIHTLHGPTELNFNFEEAWINLKDPEQTEYFSSGPTPFLKKEYHHKLNDWISSWKKETAKRRFEYYITDVSGPFLPTILAFLKYRSKIL